MPETPYFVSHPEAVKILESQPLTLPTETIPLDQGYNRIISRNLDSKVDDPRFDNSAMDGFAFHHQDSTPAPARLQITQTIQAGPVNPPGAIMKGQAARIMTGAPMPEGANAILPIELCEVDEENKTVLLLEEGKKHFIRKQGENLQEGHTALHKGTVLTPSSIGLCATMGYSEIPVFSQAKIGIVSTGDELQTPGMPLKDGEIYESNSFGLSSLVKWLGHEPIRLQCVGDTIDDLREVLNEAATKYDLILTSGGVSMGEWDLVRKIMEDEGDIHFWRIKLRPGSPPLFGLWNGTPIFGLPGNPVSSHVVFRMLVAPWIRNTTSASGPIEPRSFAKLATDVKPSKDSLTLRRVSIEVTNSGLIAHQKIHQGSGNLASVAFSEGLVLLEPGNDYSIGNVVEVILI